MELLDDDLMVKFNDFLLHTPYCTVFYSAENGSFENKTCSVVGSLDF